MSSDMSNLNENIYVFSKRVKELREQNRYTQKYVADVLGITYQSYQSYELGLTLPRAEHILKLADLFEVSIDYLFGRKEY